MGRRKGSKKGTPFERELCRKISLWWTEEDPRGPSDNIFWRTSQSGGRATTRQKAGKESRVQCADLCAIDPVGEPLMKFMTIEAKKGYAKKTIHDLLDKPARAKVQEYEKWLVKAELDRLRSGALYWCIIHMRDRRLPLIFMPSAMIVDLANVGAFFLGNSSMSASFYLHDYGSVFCTTLNTFLTGVKKNHVISVLGIRKNEPNERLSAS